MTAAKRTIRSDYYLRAKLVRSTYSVHWTNAAPNATRHLQSNDYSADRMEAYSVVTGKLYLQVRVYMNGAGPTQIKTIFEEPGRKAIKRETKEQE